MATEHEPDIMHAMRAQNPWWDGRRVPEALAGSFHRRDFYTLRRCLENEEVLAIVGPRQVEKTTLMCQLLRELIRAGVDPREILYFSFDYPYALQTLERPLSDILKVYHRYVLADPLARDPGGPTCSLTRSPG